MASKRDLVEAYSYNRRRLVTAFLSGAPGGREVEPSRPGKAIFAGVVLAALVVGGGAMAGQIQPTVKDGWDNNSLVIAKKSGARYVALDGVLYPVANSTSARLLSDPGKFKVVFAPEDRIADRKIARELFGIPGAPDSVPQPKDLIPTGWVSCVQPNGFTSMRISTTPTAVPVANQAVVARTPDGNTWVVVGESAYPIDKPDVGPVLRQLSLDATYSMPDLWVKQFPPGQKLTPLRLEAPGGASAVPGVAVGDIVVSQTATGATRYVALTNGISLLSPVQYEMYKLGAGAVKEVQLQPADLAKVKTVVGQFPQANGWPGDVPAPLLAPAACAVVKADGEARPVVSLAQPLAGYLAPTSDGVVQVDTGRGSLVRSMTQPDLLYLVDSRGMRYRIGTGTERVQLGFGKELPSFMPDAWFQALDEGPALLTEQANTKVAQTATTAGAPQATPAPPVKATPTPKPSPTATPKPKASPKPKSSPVAPAKATPVPSTAAKPGNAARP